ncbi:MAG TPA: hypothetical protein VF070_17995 [Streptosporangiaceae bacterium]
MTGTITQRVIVVEEHFATERYWSETGNLAAPERNPSRPSSSASCRTR